MHFYQEVQGPKFRKKDVPNQAYWEEYEQWHYFYYHPCIWIHPATLHVMSSVIYYMEIRNILYITYFTKKCEIGSLELENINTFTWYKITLITSDLFRVQKSHDLY